jgi:hypothetical protein
MQWGEVAEAEGRTAQVLEAAVDRFGRDDGHIRPAVQTAATALEGLLQAVAEPGVSGENLAIVFLSLGSNPAAHRSRCLADRNPERAAWRIRGQIVSEKSGQAAVYAGGTGRGSQPDDWTHNPPVARLVVDGAVMDDLRVSQPSGQPTRSTRIFGDLHVVLHLSTGRLRLPHVLTRLAARRPARCELRAVRRPFQPPAIDSQDLALAESKPERAT